MVYAGVQSILVIGKGLWIKTADVDAAAEEGAVIDLSTWGFIPNTASLIVQRTGGSQATIDVDLRGSVDNTTFADLCTVTAKDTIDTAADLAPYRYYKVHCVDEGSGNTLDLYWMLKEI